MGGQTRLSPQTPLGNFSGSVLGVALGATRGGAELETDWERFGYQWNVSMGDQWVWLAWGCNVVIFSCRGAARCAHP
jgi:hypothetical protein